MTKDDYGLLRITKNYKVLLKLSRLLWITMKYYELLRNTKNYKGLLKITKDYCREVLQDYKELLGIIKDY